MPNNSVQLIKHPQYVKIFGDNGDEERAPVFFFATTCCAMGIMSAKNYHSLEEIKDAINFIRKDSAKKFWSPEDRSGGERNVMCIVSPNEDALEKNLRKLGFKLMTDKMQRRRGYPPGLLKMYLLGI